MGKRTTTKKEGQEDTPQAKKRRIEALEKELDRLGLLPYVIDVLEEAGNPREVPLLTGKVLARLMQRCARDGESFSDHMAEAQQILAEEGAPPDMVDGMGQEGRYRGMYEILRGSPSARARQVAEHYLTYAHMGKALMALLEVQDDVDEDIDMDAMSPGALGVSSMIQACLDVMAEGHARDLGIHLRWP
jgi:hypothetical protein